MRLFNRFRPPETRPAWRLRERIYEERAAAEQRARIATREALERARVAAYVAMVLARGGEILAIEEHPSGRGKRVRYRYDWDTPGFPLPGEERL